MFVCAGYTAWYGTGMHYIETEIDIESKNLSSNYKQLFSGFHYFRLYSPQIIFSIHSLLCLWESPINKS